MKNRQECIQKLLDKGFDWADVHSFIEKQNLSVLFVPRPPDITLIWFGSTEEQQEKWDNHYKREYEREDKKWEEASIAADFETHK